MIDESMKFLPSPIERRRIISRGGDMPMFLIILSLLKKLLVVSVLGSGLYHYSYYSVLVIAAIVLSLQLIEFKDFALDDIGVSQNELLSLSKKIVYFTLPTFTYISFSYLVGLTIHECMQI